LKINRIMPFCNLFLERPSYKSLSRVFLHMKETYPHILQHIC